jgi:hypothetical protein
MALVTTDVSEERIATRFRMIRIGELGARLTVTSNRRTQTHIVFLCCLHRLLVTANVPPSSPIVVTLMMVAIRSSETSVLTRATRHHTTEDGILSCALLVRIHQQD